MSDHVYKLTEIVGTSKEGPERAIKVAVERAKQSLRNVHWFEVTGQRGYVAEDGSVTHQVTLKIGFTLED